MMTTAANAERRSRSAYDECTVQLSVRLFGMSGDIVEVCVVG